MKRAERIKLRLVFGALGAVPVFLAGWLGWVQVAQAATIVRRDGTMLPLVPASADRQSLCSEMLPAPRATIVDRRGRPLAMDHEVYDVRCTITVSPRGGKRLYVDAYLAFLGRVAAALADAMVRDTDLADRQQAREVHLAKFAERLRRTFDLANLVRGGKLPVGHPLTGEIAVGGDIDSLDVVEALRELDADPELGDWLAIHFLRTQSRSYPDRDFTCGIVGHTSATSLRVDGSYLLQRRGMAGLESLDGLDAGDPAQRRFRRDGKGRGYFLAPLAAALKPHVLHATIDIDLQRQAVRELELAAELAQEEGTPPIWAALALVEIDTGDVLAAASWHQGKSRQEAIGLSFTPYQSLYEPGSIVKPLVFAYALEAGKVDWNRVHDCRPGGAEYRETIGTLGRVVKDDHDCHDLTPHGILVNSSNIGATYVGLALEREQWRDYMDFFGFGAPLGLGLEGEPRASLATWANHSFHRSFDPSTPPRQFRRFSAVSFSFGYEFQVTALQMARAYLRLFRGDGAQLRVARGIEQSGDWQAAPSGVQPGRRLRPEVVHAVQGALIDVVSDQQGATGRHLHEAMRKELGIDLHGIVAGKTGTAVSWSSSKERGRHQVRNASFVGFLPAEAPRWLAVCVLQRDDAAKFYGGKYAAPSVARLLMRAQQLAQQGRPHQDSHVGDDGTDNTPGDSGWGRGAPGTTVEGR